MHLLAGYVLDRTSLRFAYPAFVALWSLSQISCGLAVGFWSLYTARLFLGTFEAAGQIGAARVIARVLPPEGRTLANGLMMSGGSLGAMLAPWMMITLAETVGWRIGFMVLGGLGLIWAAIWSWWFRPPPHVAVTRIAPEPWKQILADRRFWACLGGAACTIPLLHMFGSWIPKVLKDDWGIASADQRWPLFLVAAGLDVGFIAGGAAVSWLIRQRVPVPAARLAVMFGATALMGLAVLVPSAPGPWTAIGLMMIVYIGRAAWGAAFLSFNQDVAPGRVATVAGIMGCVGSLAGAGLITVIGLVADQWGGFATAFYIAAGLAVLGQLAMVSGGWNRPRGAAEPTPPLAP
jgi:ACS family hexuronate transporter-like MFS transporter